MELEQLKEQIKVELMEEILRKLPETVIALIISYNQILAKHHKFFEANPDLQQYKIFVGMVLNELEAKDPGGDMDQMLASAADEVRKRLATYDRTAKLDAELDNSSAKYSKRRDNKPSSQRLSQIAQTLTGDDDAS